MQANHSDMHTDMPTSSEEHASLHPPQDTHLGNADPPAHEDQQSDLPSHETMLSAKLAAEIYAERCLRPGHATVESAFVASKYGTSPKTVRDIWSRRTWPDATRPLWTEEERALEQQEDEEEGRDAMSDETEDTWPGERKHRRESTSKTSSREKVRAVIDRRTAGEIASLLHQMMEQQEQIMAQQRQILERGIQPGVEGMIGAVLMTFCELIAKMEAWGEGLELVEEAEAEAKAHGKGRHLGAMAAVVSQ
ncbi:hypothetical protein GUITHDRAFT_117464 [Guillardia theta CCMP2712]|uniref:Uncharacterized protein n=1 Tax=Guillardia theta (strain CCMP2712) TaxID=905079 RepID=L1IKN7_GUITC|nr:hypothetical protein GUITHDRAFT_117464 [Guillardia theta CCMP2712]EKX36355.1 hypothetical protein GUITHDRAFT_117464 [Guillardia theta CCMP2712]|eukprot:XP_005823335.1 hypothetical protein GUITHDRAFT_117464 [Guillardia theta CCMP2712]